MERNSKEIIRLVQIEKTYRLKTLEVPVLCGVNLSIQKGEFVGIMGTSGSGKSTLLNILGLLDNPTKGDYFLDGEKVVHLSDKHLAQLRNQKIGYIFQSFHLSPHLSVEKNIEVPMVYARTSPKIRKQKARELADRVKLSHRLGHRPTELSGGECQRIAIARALSNHPSYLLADEPTGNLDQKTGTAIIQLFRELHQEHRVTIVMVTHNPELESEFDRVIHLRDGQVVENIVKTRL